MNQVDKQIMETGVVPVIKLENPERDARPLAEALCAGGVPAAEVTFRAAGAEEAIRRMKGIHCGPRPTSCPDQLARGLEPALGRAN